MKTPSPLSRHDDCDGYYDFSVRPNPHPFCPTCRLKAPPRPGGCCVCSPDDTAGAKLVTHPADAKLVTPPADAKPVAPPTSNLPKPVEPDRLSYRLPHPDPSVEQRALLRAGQPPSRGSQERWMTALARIRWEEEVKQKRASTDLKWRMDIEGAMLDARNGRRCP